MPAPDVLTNFAAGAVTKVPSPAVSGLTGMEVSGVGFPETGTFKAVFFPQTEGPTPANAEVMRIEKNVGGKWTIKERAIQQTTPRTIKVGDRVMISNTQGDFAELWAAIDALNEALALSQSGTGIKIGAALNPPAVLEAKDGPNYVPTFLANFDSWTPEYGAKMGTTYPGTTPPSSANVTLIKEMAAKLPNKAMRFHTLIWHFEAEVPTWVKKWNEDHAGTTAEKEAAMTVQAEKYVKNTIRAALQAVPGMNAIDVLNEVAADTGEKLRGGSESAWGKIYGTTTISKTNKLMVFYANCFKWADEVCKELGRPCILFYNEYSVETDFNYSGNEAGANTQSKGKAALKICEVLKELGAPITGFGMQTHRHVDQPPTLAELETHIAQFQALTLKVEITEFDLNFRKEGLEGRAEGSLATQEAGYATVIKACEAKGIERFTTWGLWDGDSWKNGQEGEPANSTVASGARPLPFDVNFVAKGAFTPMAKARAGASKAKSAVEVERERALAAEKVLREEIQAVAGGGVEEKPKEEGGGGAHPLKFGINGNKEHTSAWVPNKVNWLRAAGNPRLEPEYTTGMSEGTMITRANEVSAAVGTAIAEGWSPVVLINPPDSYQWDASVTPANYGAFVLKVVQTVIGAHPTAKIFELGNEPFGHIEGANPKTSAKAYAESVKAAYEAVSKAGIALAPQSGGVTLLVAMAGEYSLDEGATWKHWVTDVATTLGSTVKALVNGFTEHPYGLAYATTGEEAAHISEDNHTFLSMVHRREQTTAQGFPTYANNNWWMTEFGFDILGGSAAKVPDQKTQREQYEKWLAKSLKAAEEGWLTAIFPYNQNDATFGIYGREAQTTYAQFALAHGA